jgi:hypothetical protein
LLLKLQELLNKTVEDWEKLRLPYIELIKWSTLSAEEKKKWLEFYNQPNPEINLSEGENHANQTQKHPQTNEPWPA